MSAEKIREFIERYWLGFGLFALLSGMYLFPSRNAYKTGFYLSLLLPVVVLLVWGGWRKLPTLFRTSTWLWVAVYAYFVLSSAWGNQGEVLTYAKHALMTFLAALGIFWVYADQTRFDRICMAAIVVVAGVAALWIIDYYLLLDHAFSTRFMMGAVDYLQLYSSEDYGTFYNPLLLSHTLVFFVALTIQQFFRRRDEQRAYRGVLLLCSVPLILLLILAQTRSAWGTATVVLMFNLLWYWRGRGLLALLALAVIAGVGFVLGEEVVLRRGLSYRPEIWQQSLAMVMDSVVWGRGMGAELSIYLESAGRTFYDAHNFLLESFYFGGLIGLGLWLIFLISVARDGIRRGADLGWVGSWLLVFVVGGMADGAGMLDRPNERWFHIVLPLIFVLCAVQTAGNKRLEIGT
jgi:O-antigen ligase